MSVCVFGGMSMCLCFNVSDEHHENNKQMKYTRIEQEREEEKKTTDQEV